MILHTPQDLSIEYKYRKTHEVFKRKGTDVDLRNLENDESVIYGDGETYHYLLKGIKK